MSLAWQVRLLQMRMRQVLLVIVHQVLVIVEAPATVVGQEIAGVAETLAVVVAENKMRPIKLTLGILVLVLVILVLALAAVWYFDFGKAVPYSASNTPYKILSKSNEAFLRAESAYLSGDFTSAQTYYEKALADAKDPVQEAQIAYKIAVLHEKQKNIPLAISEYKKIVGNPTYANYPIVKAYALQSLAEIYYGSGDAAVTAAIFNDAPYKDMLAGATPDVAYRKLEEYALTFYPLALPELRMAIWYVTDYSKNKNATSSERVTGIVNAAVANADMDIARTKSDTNAAMLIPNIVTRKCALYLKMYEAGLSSVGDAETVCKNAVETFTSVGKPEQDGYARYYYAVVLSQQGVPRSEDVKSALATFASTPGQYADQDVAKFFASEKSNRLGQKTRLISLSKIDPLFRKYLTSLGWNETDFASASN